MQASLIILSFLYATTGIIAILGYLPTIKDLIKKVASANISSYLIWTFCGTVSFLYALLILKDQLVEIVTGLNFISCLIILLLALRIKYKKKTKTFK
jgi:uncharacterized membrane protein